MKMTDKAIVFRQMHHDRAVMLGRENTQLSVITDCTKAKRVANSRFAAAILATASQTIISIVPMTRQRSLAMPASSVVSHHHAGPDLGRI
jgi:hypothetical protein